MSSRSIDPSFVIRVGELPEGRTKKFILNWEGREEEAFVVNHRGQLFAYVNRCRHVPMTMDWIDNQFLSEDGAFLQCATHGALYRPDTGECVEGPPVGKVLFRVDLTVVGADVLAVGVAADT